MVGGCRPTLPNYHLTLVVGAKVVPSVALSGIQPCRMMASAVKHGWVVPYADIIVYEAGSWSPSHRPYLS
jgi:hypothetical protein